MVSPVISVWSVINLAVTFQGLILCGSQIFCVIFSKTKCCLKGDRHKYTRHRCVHIEAFRLIRRIATISLSHDRENLLHVQHVICWNVEIVWPIFVIAFGSRVSFGFRVSCSLVFFCRDKIPCTYQLFAILENSTLRRDCDLFRQVTLYLTNQFGRVLLVSRAFRRNRTVHSRRTCRDKGPQIHRRQFWLCHDPVVSFLFLHYFRHRFGEAGQAENSERSRESWNGWC